ncbi:MAG: DEAD/DEAH box helicase family protein [Cyanobacteriota bacterium]|nr:DEAD/DEAH box helicase family protein [Cyanobacteriota bacterium]
MQDTLLKERNFEEAIENYLITEGGYDKGVPEHLNRASALDEETFLNFIKTTQPTEWEKHCKNYPTNPEQALLRRFQEEVSATNLLQVLRHGFKDRGVKFYPCYFKPETKMNPEHNERYAQNILHCTRQMKFSLKDERSIDIVLLLNGIPVVSMELKNQFTGQDVSNAISQYKFDRATKDKMFEFKQRVLVHFAVDLYDVFMTTRLQGASTYFLPFNQGSNGAGEVGGKGNPQTEDDYMTSYLWKRVLTKDSLMEILHKYMHLKVEDIKDKDGKITGKKETMIFPRYHQLDVVTKLLADVKENGSGKNYLIQHSAGSGKSNSIAWLAHRLQSLHDKNDEVIFNSVIVVTDRKILDSQLQDTIYQFDHIDGVVRPITKGSDSLKTALNDGAKIIITTLQKFPYIYQDVQSTGKRYAVIVDEAHSSQSGTAAKKLKVALGDTEEVLEQYAREEAEEENQREDYEDNLVKELSSHGMHDNISFFAFTATPKNKTLQLFGERQENGTYRPFHIYSMRQAIEEGFILDVLQNYTTYKQYYQIAKKIEGDPEYDKAKGARAVSRFESLHPHNIAQKTAIMIEHFREVTKNKIDGRAKAMVVTASRLHAIRYLFEFRRYIQEHNYHDLDVLVAFSGSLEDNGQEWTEEKINRTKDGEVIKETQLKKYFHDEFDMLIVAEKYQTGFDEPLLHTMFVDKKLNSVKAVQTLSRLNRTMRGKEDTFVLDFANTQEEIQRAFQPFYEATVLEGETDPNLIYTLKRQLDDFHVYQEREVEEFAKKFYQKTMPTLSVLSPILKPAVERYEALEDKQKDEFKSLIHGFNRTYSFITQICRMFDKDMQKLYVFTKYLTKLLPKNNSEKVNLNDALLLEYYKLQKTAEGNITLEKTEGVVPPISGAAGSGGKEKEKGTLSEILDKFNKKFGTNFTEQDKVLAQLKADMMKNEQMANSAKSGDKTAFRTLYDKQFNDIAINRYEENDNFFKGLFENADKLKFIKELLLADVYNELRNMKDKE